jgi:hypothetical protein
MVTLQLHATMVASSVVFGLQNLQRQWQVEPRQSHSEGLAATLTRPPHVPCRLTGGGVGRKWQALFHVKRATQRTNSTAKTR